MFTLLLISRRPRQIMYTNSTTANNTSNNTNSAYNKSTSMSLYNSNKNGNSGSSNGYACGAFSVLPHPILMYIISYTSR